MKRKVPTRIGVVYIRQSPYTQIQWHEESHRDQAASRSGPDGHLGLIDCDQLPLDADQRASSCEASGEARTFGKPSGAPHGGKGRSR